MVEVPRFICGTDNRTGCKKLGGILAVLNVICLIISVPVNFISTHMNTQDKVIILMTYSIGIFSNVLLILGAMTRSRPMLLMWMIFNVIVILGYAYESLYVWINFGAIPIAIWAELVGYGAIKEELDGSNTEQVQPSVREVIRQFLYGRQTETGGAPSYPPTQVQTSETGVLPYPPDPELPTYAQTQFGAPTLPSLQQDTSKNQSTSTLNYMMCSAIGNRRDLEST